MNRMDLMDLSDDTVLPVRIVWSKKYAVPIFIVGDSEYNDGEIKRYVPMTGEFGGYYEEYTKAPKEEPES